MRLIPVITLILALISAACSAPARRAARADMSRAEALFDSLPDSALAILSAIPSSQLGRADRSRLAILRAEARYKAGFDDTASSALDSAVQYLRLRISNPLRARAYHLSAIHAYNRADYSHAVLSLLNAEKSAELTSDSLRLALIYRSLADCFTNTRDFTSASNYYNASYSLFSKMHSYRYESFSLLDVARSYHNRFDYDSAISFCDSILIHYSNNTDPYLIRETHYLKFDCLSGKRDFSEALRFYESEVAPNHPSRQMRDWYQLGIGHYILGNIEKAKQYNDSILSYNNSSPSKVIERLYLNALINRKSGKAEECLFAIDTILSYQNNVIERLSTDCLTSSVFNHYKTEQEFMKADLRNKRFINGLFIALLLSVIIGFIIFFIYRHRLYVSELNNRMNTIREFSCCIKNLEKKLCSSEEQMNRADKSLKFARKNLSELMSARFSTIDRFCNTFYETSGSRNAKDIIFRKVKQEVEALIADEHLFDDLTLLVDSTYDKLMTRFKTDLPGISKDDCKLFILHVIGFSGLTISIFLNIKISTLYTRKSRLKQKILELDSQYKNEYLSFLK